ncbi:filamentous hemagglutinin N-terminal domain-containing protein [Brasilonema sennae]|nr:filamentous hemagglutinin N-terminal domain-containing protein [Brasilonema sennae]
MSFRNTRWFLGIAVGGAFGAAVSLTFALAANSASAQITPDATLPNNSTVTINGNTFNIDGGTIAGRNLFHSFQQFSVPTLNTASFNNAVNIQNIFSRVTGTSVSNIDGIIKALGTANLFLINPNGIIFGPNASLNVGGSFVGTTANAIQFGNQGFWSATNPNNPALLTVNPSALFFNQIAAAARIENNSVADAGLNPSSSFTARGLRVPDGRSLLLVGGDIKMDGGRLSAFGGRVELGGLRSAGTVGLNGDGNNLSLSFPNSVERSDVSLSNGAQVNVPAGGGGSIAVNARNLEMTGSSELLAGIGTGLDSSNSKAGNISVNATGAINLNNSFIENVVLQQANGQGGDVNISASSLRLEGGAQVFTGTFGAGKGGNLSVDAQDVQLIGTSADGQFGSGLFAQAGSNSTGNAGDLTLKTNTLLVRDGAQVFTGTFGAGKGGNLSVDAQDVQIIGTSADARYSSSLQVSTGQNSTGNAGDLTIKTNTLLVRDGAGVITRTLGEGNTGNITITANTTSLDGAKSAVSNTSGVSLAPIVSVKLDEQNRRVVTVESPQQTVFPNARGNSGYINITTESLSVTNGARLDTSTSAQGKAGNISVNTRNAKFSGTDTNGTTSGAFSTVQKGASGNGGVININTADKLTVDNGAQLVASTFGNGNAGEVRIVGKEVVFNGVSGSTPSGAFSAVASNGVGNGGNINVRTGSLSVTNGAQLSAAVEAGASGNGGNLTIATKRLNIVNEAEGTVSNLGSGNAGNLEVKADFIDLNNQGKLTANSRTGFGGNTELNVKDILLMRRDSLISNTSGTPQEGGNEGNLTLRTKFLVAPPNENNDIITNAFTGEGGNINIVATGRIYGFVVPSRLDFEKLSPANRDPRQLPTNDIVASSRSNLNIFTFLDPSNGLVSLPAYVFDPSNQIVQGCAAFDQPNASDFKVTGRGGLPPSPDEPLSSDAVWEDTRLRAIAKQRLDSKTTATKPKSESDTVEIIPATGWVFNGKGEVTLVSQTPNATVENLAGSSQSCRLR